MKTHTLETVEWLAYGISLKSLEQKFLSHLFLRCTSGNFTYSRVSRRKSQFAEAAAG